MVVKATLMDAAAQEKEYIEKKKVQEQCLRE